jgi:TonB-linked SusC/RagA family outer membrane protein
MKSILQRMTLLTALLFLSQSAWAQFKVSGKISDEKGEALVGVSVVVKGTTNGTITDVDGNYSLQVSSGKAATLVLSYVGYASMDVAATATSGTLNLTLKESAARLEEVVVTGLASNIKRSNASNSVSHLGADDLNGTTKPMTLDAALSGKLVGANIQSNSGAPGGGVSVKLRGLSSLTLSSEPLYVIDGIIVDNSQFATGAGTRAFNGAVSAANAGSQDQAANRISDINPADIESIDVLKGPSASAIYGTRANAGVIVITTKRGKSGKTKISLNQDFGQISASNLLESEGWTPAKMTQYYNFNGTAYAGGPTTLAAGLAELTAANGKSIDYDKEFFGEKGQLINTNVSVSGGTDKTKYYVGVGYNKETGILKNTGYERYSARVNLDHKINDFVDVQVSSAYYNSNSSRSFLGNDNNGVSIGYTIAYVPSFLDLRPTVDPASGKTIYPDAPTGQNPYEVRDRMENKEFTQRFLNSGSVNFKLYQTEATSLKFSIKGGVDYLNSQPRVYAPEDVQYQKGFANPGASRYATNIAFNSYIQSFLTLNWKVGEVDLISQAGLLRNQRKTDESYLQGEGLLAGQRNPATANVKISAQYLSRSEDAAADLSQDFNWGDKVIGRVGVRFDKSSLNSDNTKVFAFPRASIAVNLTKFDFLKDNAILSQLKPRIAFGRTGGVPGYGDIYSTLAGVVYGGSLGIVTPTVLGNNTLEPETAQEIEMGLDFGFLKNRITLEATYFDKRIYNLLDAYVLSPSTGVTSIAKYNIGDMSNKGIELGITANVVKNAMIDWSTTFSFWNVRSNMDKLLVNDKFTGAGFGNFGRMRLVQGYSPTAWYGRDSAGKSPVRFTDANGNIKDAQARYNLSWQNNITFAKNFEFKMLWHTSQGAWISSLTRELKDEAGTTYDWSTIGNEGVANGVSSRLYASSPKYTTDNYLIDASYIRLREIALYYTVPNVGTLTNNAISNIRVGISAQNILTISPALKATYDPEASNFGNQATGFGVDLTPFPAAKRMFAHLIVSF